MNTFSQLLKESLTDLDYRTELTFTVDGMVGRDTRVRAEYEGGKVISIGVWRPDGKLELITRFGNDTSGVLKMALPELVRSKKLISIIV